MSQMTDMVSVLAENNGLTKKLAKQVFDDVVSLMTKELLKTGRLPVPNLGVFTVVTTKERTTHLKTVASGVIPASKRVKFKPALALKEAVKQ